MELHGLDVVEPCCNDYQPSEVYSAFSFSFVQQQREKFPCKYPFQRRLCCTVFDDFHLYAVIFGTICFHRFVVYR